MRTAGNSVTSRVSIETSLLSRSDSQRSRSRARRGSAVWTNHTAAPAASVAATSTVPASTERQFVIDLQSRSTVPVLF